jgi:hypothetical protein
MDLKRVCSLSLSCSWCIARELDIAMISGRCAFASSRYGVRAKTCVRDVRSRSDSSSRKGTRACFSKRRRERSSARSLGEDGVSTCCGESPLYDWALEVVCRLCTGKF